MFFYHVRGSGNINHVHFCLPCPIAIHTRMKISRESPLLGPWAVPLLGPGRASHCPGLSVLPKTVPHPPLSGLTIYPQCLQGLRQSRGCSPVTLCRAPPHPGLRIRVGVVASDHRHPLSQPQARGRGCGVGEGHLPATFIPQHPPPVSCG